MSLNFMNSPVCAVGACTRLVNVNSLDFSTHISVIDSSMQKQMLKMCISPPNSKYEEHYQLLVHIPVSVLMLLIYKMLPKPMGKNGYLGLSTASPIPKPGHNVVFPYVTLMLTIGVL